MAYSQLNSLCFLQNMVTFHSWFQADAFFSTSAVAPFLFVPIIPK